MLVSWTLTDNGGQGALLDIFLRLGTLLQSMDCGVQLTYYIRQDF